MRKLLIISMLLNLILVSFIGIKGYGRYFAPPIVDDLLSRQEYRNKVAMFRELPVTKGQVVFVGDSLVDGGEWNELLGRTDVLNRGISGNRTFGVLNMMDTITVLSPSQIFIQVGINDITAGRTIPDIVTDYNKILSELKVAVPQSKVFVHGVFPVVPNPKIERLNNDNVRKLNIELKRIAQNHGYTFVDIFDKLLADGKLNPQFTHDGLHLNSTGYKVWATELKKYM